MAKEMMEEKWKGMHKGKGWMMLVLGVLVLLNVYALALDWATFIGIILVLAGLVKLAMK